MTQSAKSIQLVRKACQVVDEVSALGPISAADLAKAVDEPRPSVYRITSTLEQYGMLRRSPEGLVELGPGILRLAEASTDALVDHPALKSILENVQSNLGMTAALWIPRNGTAVCLEQVDSTDVDLHELTSGRILPLHAGAASHVLLAWQPSEVLENLLAQAPFHQLSSRTPVDGQVLRDLIMETKSNGWRLESNEVVDGIAAIGFPVFNPDGSIFGALTAAGLVNHVLSQQATAKSVLSAAAQELNQMISEFTPAPPEHQFQVSKSNGSVLAKASALMNALAAERVATSARLAELIEEPVSSVYRMLGTLVDAGWIEQLGHRGSYRIGSKLISLAGRLLNKLDLRRAALPVLREIHEVTGETVFLCIRRNTRAVCIERIDGKRVNSRLLALGSSLPLHVGAAPRTLLAFDSVKAWEEYAAVMGQSTDVTVGVRSRSEFFGMLHEIQDSGYALSSDELTPGIAAVAAPIFDHRGHVIASLSVSGLREGILPTSDSEMNVTDLTIDGAMRISKYFGAPA